MIVEWIIDEDSIDHNDLLSARCANKAYPLVRCKDCKNVCVYDDDEVICTHIDSNGNDKHPADWFCADGERKSD
jgi:hypothetical protein